MKEVVPDYVQAITGWRSWMISTEPPRLLSMNHSAWPTLAPLRARCTILRPDAHSSPCVDCGCGIYAHKRLEELEGMPLVFGTVALWGEVLEHETGYRAENAYPLQLYSAAEDVSSVAREYGVPFTLLKQPVSILKLADGTEMNFEPLWPKYSAEINLSAWNSVRRGLGLAPFPNAPLRFLLENVQISEDTLTASYRQEADRTNDSPN